MSYNLIKKINNQLIQEVPNRIFPFQYGTMGALAASLMIPVYGTESIAMLQRDLQSWNLNSDEGSLAELQQYIDTLGDTVLSEVSQKVFSFINREYLGILRSFFEEEVWQVDVSLANALENKEEFRDSILLFVFSVPVFPVSLTMRDVMMRFHIFESDEAYVEMQSVLNEMYTETPKCQRHYLAWKYLDSLNENACQELMQKLEKRVPFTCDGCGSDIKELKAPFITRIEVYPSRNLSFDQDDDEVKDYESEINNILETVAQKSDKEITKEMWTEYRLFLCPRCRNTFVKRIEAGEFI